MWYAFVIGDSLLVYDRSEIRVCESFFNEWKVFLIDVKFNSGLEIFVVIVDVSNKGNGNKFI